MKNLLLALLSGLLLAAAWPTYGWAGLLFIGFVPLLFVSHNLLASKNKQPNWKMLGLAYVSFFVFNIITTHWLYYSTGFGMWFAVLANSLLMATTWCIYFFVAKRTPIVWSFVFLIGIWMLFEWLHLHWEFSWPWLNLGNGFATNTEWIQWYSYTGAFGGTLWVWVVNTSIFLFLRKFFMDHKGIAFAKKIVIIFLLIGIPIGISQIILNTYIERIDPVEVVLLQPNIDPYTEKYDISNNEMADYLFADAIKALDDKAAYLIAPETALAEGYGTDLRNFKYSMEETKAQEFLTAYPNLNFLTGIQFYRFYKNSKDIIPTSNYLGQDRVGDSIWGDFFNSAVLFNQKEATQIYHKSRLVVGVENFPYQSFLKPILGDAMIDLGGTVSMKTSQAERSVFTGVDGSTVGPIICYESVYGEFVTGYVNKGASFLAVITNDGWWGESQGHKQHLNYARLRAIENRRSVARSANTGISAIIDQTGTITRQLAYGKYGTVKGSLNKNDTITFYTRYGDYLPRIAVAFVVGIFIFGLFRGKKKNR